MALSLIYIQRKFKILPMGKYNYQYSLFIAIYTVMAELQLLLGRIHLDLEEFVEAQTQLQTTQNYLWSRAQGYNAGTSWGCNGC